MKQSKHLHDLNRVEAYGTRFRKVSSIVLTKRLHSAGLYKEAAIAIRRVLQERQAKLPVPEPLPPHAEPE